jgi:hypothetical protein
MGATKERQRLTEACTNLLEALMVDDPQKMAESIALMYESMREFIETGYVSYEAIDCELIKLEKGEKEWKD